MPPVPTNRSQSPHRSNSRKPYERHSRNDSGDGTGASSTLRATASPASSHGSVSPGSANRTAGTSSPLAATSPAHSQNLDDQSFVSGAPEGMQVPRLMPLIDVPTVAPPQVLLTSPSNPVKVQQLLAAQPATYILTVPQEQHLGSGSPHQLSHQYPPQLQLRGSTSSSSAYPPSLIDGIFVDRAPDNISGQAMWSLCPLSPTNANLVAPQHIHPASPSNSIAFVPRQTSLITHPASHALTAAQQQSLRCDTPIQSSSQYLTKSQPQSSGMFNRAHNFTVTGTFVDGNVYNNVSSNEFMEKFLMETIPGAASDSSARDPPPRCHPGTRLAILKRCLDFIHNRDNAKKMRWVVGSAGVGKSAIMQSVAESPDLQVDYHASIFFSINGRADGTKAIMTLSYQCAAKCGPYRQLIEREITRDPSLLRSSMANQFKSLIMEPFINDPRLKSASRLLMIIDGLDECNDPRLQLELLRLISNFCTTYPSSPLVWLIASRPEPHITSFFARPEVLPAYEKEEVRVDSNEARADVERFLRHEFDEIKKGSDSLDPQWPEEWNLWKLANAAGGLFAYAQTVIRYIGDWRMGSPVSLLSDVLHVIDELPLIDLSGEEHPMALLDALYARILSNVPPKIMINTRKLLLSLASGWDYVLKKAGSFVVVCNWLGMTPDEAYAALNHLRSVLDVPRRDQAGRVSIKPFHKSFIDYVSDFTRSQFSPDIRCEAQQLAILCASRILKEAPDGVFMLEDSSFRYGHLASASSTGGEISLVWSVGKGSGWSDNTTRQSLYQLAMGEIVGQIKRGDSTFQSELCVRLLTARFTEYSDEFPLAEFRDWVFAPPRHSDFTISRVLKHVPLGTVNLSAIVKDVPVKLQFRGPATTVANSFPLWFSSCQHERIGEWAEGKIQDWMTDFICNDCAFCYTRLQLQLRRWKGQFPAHAVLILFTSTGVHCVEVRYVDPQNDASEWTYWFWFQLYSPQLVSP